MYAIHHYELANGLIVDFGVIGATSVSNYQFEERLNEQKRIIQILNPLLVSDFIKEFEILMGN